MQEGSRLTRIFLSLLVVCAVDTVLTSGLAEVVVLATHGDVQETLSWKAEPPSIAPLPSAHSPTHYPETLGYRVAYLGCSSRPPPTRAMTMRREVGVPRVVESSGRVAVRSRGGSLPIGIETGEQA